LPIIHYKQAVDGSHIDRGVGTEPFARPPSVAAFHDGVEF
jgi:hypothetical protein